MDGRTPKMNQHLDVIRVYQNWLEFETSIRRDMVDTKLKILFTPSIYVGIVTVLGKGSTAKKRFLSGIARIT